MNVLARSLLLSLIPISLLACAPADEQEQQDEKADESAVTLRLELGESLLDLSVKAVTSSQPSSAEDRATLLPMHFRLLAGQSAAITMRAQSADFNPYLHVREVSTNTEVAANDDQVILSSLGENDALLTLSAVVDTNYVIFAQGGRLRTSAGTFTIDATAIDEPLIDLSTESVRADIDRRRALSELRSREEKTVEFLDASKLSESDDGYLVFNKDATPLSDWNTAKSLVSIVNKYRNEVAALALGTDGEDIEQVAAVNRGLAPLYRLTH